jgi:hypothetical protein
MTKQQDITPEMAREFKQMVKEGRYTMSFSFAMPDVLDEWINKRGRFAKNAHAVVHVSPGIEFKSGSIWHGDEEVGRLVKVKTNMESVTLTAANGDQWCLLRKWCKDMEGHSFLREFSVEKLPGSNNDHKRNMEWMVERIQVLIPSNIAEWNKARVMLSFRKDIIAYAKIFGLNIPKVSQDEAAFITRMRIIGEMSTADIDKTVEQYEAVCGKGCLGDAAMST